MALRIFDLDETLVRCDSSFLFCEYLVERNLVEDSEYLTKERELMELYSHQKLQIDDYINFQIAPLDRLKLVEIEQLAAEFVATKMRQCTYPEARELLRELSQQGHRIVIISATVAFIVRAIAKELGVEDVIGIDLQEVNGKYTGAIKGVPSYREGKVTRLQQWLQEQRQSLTQAHFYSDSMNDLPLLELVETPVGTNPDIRLAKIANERNWQLLSWQLVPSSV